MQIQKAAGIYKASSIRNLKGQASRHPLYGDESGSHKMSKDTRDQAKSFKELLQKELRKKT